MVTLHDVARLAGVSTGTVSNVINRSDKVAPDTARRVREAIRELNYIPNTLARSLKTSRSQVVGIIVEDMSCFSSGDIIDGICEAFEEPGYTVNLCNLRVNARAGRSHSYQEMGKSDAFRKSIHSSLNLLLTSRVCGLIYIGVHTRDLSGILPELDIPVVYTYSYTENNDYCVNYDDYQGACIAMNHLIEMGHEKIAVLCGPIDSVPSHKRMMGYQTSLMKHHLTFHPEYVRTGSWFYEDGYRLCGELLRLADPPTAIFSMNDKMAYGAIHAALDAGLRVPEDLSVHGFDNLDLTAYSVPALTTVDLPLRSQGLQAARMLLSLLDGQPPEERSLLIPCTHVARETVKRITPRA